jgi:CheY-like chemotaxis protein
MDKPVVLIVDDDHDLREVLSYVLADNGYEMASCNNGQEAFEWLRTHSAPAIIFVDLMMPIMNGREFMRRLAKDPKLRDIPAIVMSASANIQVEFGAHCLPKPFNVKALIEVVQMVSKEDQPRP